MSSRRETPEPPADRGTVTTLLEAWSEGEPAAFDALLPLVYAQLRQLAERQLRSERRGHTLQATDLIHEAYLRLVGHEDHSWTNRSHFLRVAARVMRHILVDHARGANAQRRPSPGDRVPLEGLDVWSSPATEILAVHEALEQLAAADERQARLVELRYFGGLTVEETAQVLQVSVPTVVRDWRFARAFIRRLLQQAPGTAEAATADDESTD
jgi:RNA polymerase sigma factor (TIGR02999 family)